MSTMITHTDFSKDLTAVELRWPKILPISSKQLQICRWNP
jgi:hypothetical protein